MTATTREAAKVECLFSSPPLFFPVLLIVPARLGRAAIGGQRIPIAQAIEVPILRAACSSGDAVLRAVQCAAIETDELIEAYAPYVQLGVHDEEDGWILMTAQR